jgi:prepilin peptidase CpaA
VRTPHCCILIIRVPPLPIASQVLLCLIVIPCGIYDYRSQRVPNWLTLPGILLGVGFNTFRAHTAGLWVSIQGLGLALAIYGLLYLLRALGAGDVKLMAAVGAVVGPAHWLRIFILTALCGGVVALVLIVVRGRFRHTLSNAGLVLASLGRGRAPHRASPELDVRSTAGMRLPHAVMIACGTFLYVLLAPWL